MPSALNQLKLSHKLGLILGISLCGMIVTLLMFYQGLKESLVEEKKAQAQIMSEAGLAAIKHFHTLSEDGLEEASFYQIAALNALRSVTFGDNGYFWINDSEAFVRMHPYLTDSENDSLLNFQDETGKYVFHEFINTAKNGGGIVRYYWPKPDDPDGSFRKMSYVDYFEPWDWILGTGIYIDEMEKEINDYATHAIAIVFLFAMFFTLTTMYFLRSLVHQLNLHAIKDPLTQLFTRRHLTENIPGLIRRINRNQDLHLSVIYMDIDHFKQINDNYGHGMGDQVIAFVGETIASLSRPDDVCFRYGGEEFLIVSISEHEEAAHLLVDRIRSRICSHVFTSGKNEFSITLSVGIASHNRKDLLERTISIADEHLYQAKQAGRDRVVPSQKASNS